MASRTAARSTARRHAPAGAPARDLYQEVTDTIVAALEAGTAPWARSYDPAKCGPGSSLFGAPLVLPRNGLTGRAYSGINVLLLWVAAQVRGYDAAEWYTFNQAAEAVGLAKDAAGRWVPEAGKGVRKGERATLVTFWKQLSVDDAATGEQKRVPLLRYFNVFNRAQIDGLPAPVSGPAVPAMSAPAAAEATTWAPIAAAEQLVRDTGARVMEGEREPFYGVRYDVIGMPPRAAYPTAEAFYVDLLHELAHWTGHPTRLDRPFTGLFGSPDYAREELVAELSAAFVCASLGITGKLQHPEYIAHWVTVLKSDKRAVFAAASQARQACEFLRGAGGDVGDAAEDTAAGAP